MKMRHVIIVLCAVMLIYHSAAFAQEDVRHVYPEDFEGEKTEKGYSTLLGALRGTDSTWSSPQPAAPGVTIVVHNGTIKADRFSYRDKHHLENFGTYFPSRSLYGKTGMPEKPITIKSAGDGEAILDGAGCAFLLDLTSEDHYVIERITFANCDVGILAGEKDAGVCQNLKVRNCTFRNVQVGLWNNHPAARNYEVTGNTFIGREGEGLKTNGLTVAGSGHTIENNTFQNISHEMRVLDGDPEAVEKTVPGGFVTVPVTPAEGDTTTARGEDLIEEPATLHSLAFSWPITGNANGNAAVKVEYRRSGEEHWKPALPMFRVDYSMNMSPFGREGLAPEEGNFFSSSIMNLKPGTDYECRFTLTDPDGGEAVVTRTCKTKPVPAMPEDGRLIDVSSTEEFNRAIHGKLEPGDIINVHAGTYEADPKEYMDVAGNLTLGGWQIHAHGTAEKPIVIRAAGDGPVIFDGKEVEVVMDMRMSRYVWLHGIEMKTGLIGILACNRAYGPGMPAPGRTWEPVEGLKVTLCKINDVYIGLYGLGPRTSDFYIADNTLVAREWKNEYDSKWLHLYSEGGIDLSGQGHTVAHNAIDNFWDGSNWYTGSVGCDIYGNIVTNQKDNSFVMASARNCGFSRTTGAAVAPSRA